MQRMVFLIVCIALINAPISAQISSFSQRGKATQGIIGNGFTIAHPNLPINSQVKVTNTANGKEVEATVIDRIPASNDRIADVSRGVWNTLGLNPDTDILLSVNPPPRQRTSEPAPVQPPAPSVAKSPSPSPTPTPAPSPAPTAAESRSTAQETRPASNSDFYITLKNMLREDVYLPLLKDVIRENQPASSPSTQVITVYPPYPPQSVVTNQSVINDSAPANTAYPQVTAAQPAYVPPPNQGPVYQAAPQYQGSPALPAAPPNQGPAYQAAPQYQGSPALPAAPQYQGPPTLPVAPQYQGSPTLPAAPLYQGPPAYQAAPQYQGPALPVAPPNQRMALPATPANQDCYANSKLPPNQRTALPATPTNQDCYANSKPPPTKLQIIPGLPNPNGKGIYHLQVGSFCDPGTANGLEYRLKAAGFNVAREYYNTLHRVIVTGIPAAMVQSTVQRLEAMGIKQIWVK